MKLVIHTQAKENYGAHTWDGNGECPQQWKFKGGSTYVVENIIKSQAAKISKDGIPSLTNLIESFSEGYEEYILEYNIVRDCDTPWEDYAPPWFLNYVDSNWIASRKPTHWTIPVKEQYTMLPKGDRDSYGYTEL